MGPLTFSVPEPPLCACCGAAPLADHAQGCNWLSAIKAQAYPELIDQNGMPWHFNALREKDLRIERLHEALREVRELIDGYVDVRDGPEGTQCPNNAMRAQALIDETLREAGITP